MEKNVYHLMKEAQFNHWWYLGKRKMIQAVLESEILHPQKLKIAEVGCCYGGNISLLQQYGEVTGLETLEEANQYIQEKWGNSVKLVRARVPEPLSDRFDLIVMADVLEHIFEDMSAVDWIHEHLNPGGYTLITVPAHQWLWTQMDELNHHYRRYNHKTLSALFDRKFEIVRFSYYNFSLLPIRLCHVLFEWLRKRLTLKSAKRMMKETPFAAAGGILKYLLYPKIPPECLNQFLKYVLYLEAKLIQLGMTFPTGVNIVLIARKLPELPKSNIH